MPAVDTVDDRGAHPVTQDLASVVLAAGLGTRLRPLTDLRPKALCPVGNVALVDRAVTRVRPYADGVAVNVHHGRDLLVPHLDELGVHVSVEDVRLETGGALGKLRPWIDGRPVLALNADAYHEDDLGRLVDGWDGERVRLLTVADRDRGDFGDQRYCGAAMLPWRLVRGLPEERVGLYRAIIAPEREAGRLDLVESGVPYFDCGTPQEYLAANLHWSGGSSVIGETAVVEGDVDRCVVWDGARVEPDERLVEAIRAPGGVTVDAS